MPIQGLKSLMSAPCTGITFSHWITGYECGFNNDTSPHLLLDVNFGITYTRASLCMKTLVFFYEFEWAVVASHFHFLWEWKATGRQGLLYALCAMT